MLYQEKGTNKKKLKNIAVVHSLFCQRQSYLSWYVPYLHYTASLLASACCIIFLAVLIYCQEEKIWFLSILTVSVEVPLHLRREKKNHPKIYRITSTVAHQVTISIINLLLCWSIILKSQRFLLCQVWYFLSSH